MRTPQCIRRSFALLALLFMVASGHGQMISIPTAKKADPKPEPPRQQVAKPKPKPKAVARIKDEDDDNETAAKKEGEGQFAALLFKANRGAAINVYINDTLIGKVKANASRRIYVDKDDYLEIKLDDGVGNRLDTSVFVGEADKGQLIAVQFPEIDYDGPRREAIRQKRVADSTAIAERRLLAEAERAAKMEEARLAKELAEAEKAAKLEELRMAKEEAERQRLARLASMKAQFADLLSAALAAYGANGQALNGALEGFRNGDVSMDAAKGIQQQYAEAQMTYMGQRKLFFDSLDAGGFAEEKKQYLAANVEAEKAANADAAQAFLRKAINAEVAASRNLEVALRSNRKADLKFFIPADSINRPFVGGKTPVDKAIEFNSDSTTLLALVAMGAEVTNFGTRLERNPDVYNTLLARTVANGNRGAVRVLAAAKAELWPSSIPKKQRKMNAAYVNSLAAPHAGMKELLVQLGYDMDDGTAAIEAAAAEIAASMVAVQAGTFRMGCPPNDQSCAGDEKGGNKVTVDAFSIGSKEVTQQQWAALMEDARPSAHKDCPTCPVENITWEEVQKFIEALNKATGKLYRLPYESEWEYAAKGGHLIDTNLYKLPPFPGAGNKPDSLCWYDFNSGGATHFVGTKQPNALGIYDMGGNVAEMCQDWYEERFYDRMILQNPKGPETGDRKAYRGGAYNKSDFSVRVTNRDWVNAAARSPELGFRLAISTP